MDNSSDKSSDKSDNNTKPCNMRSAFHAYSRSSLPSAATSVPVSAPNSSSTMTYHYWPQLHQHQYQSYQPQQPPVQMPSLQHKWHSYWHGWQHYYADHYPTSMQQAAVPMPTVSLHIQQPAISPAASPIIRSVVMPHQHQQHNLARFSLLGRSSLPMSGSSSATGHSKNRGNARARAKPRASLINTISPMTAIEPLDLRIGGKSTKLADKVQSRQQAAATAEIAKTECPSNSFNKLEIKATTAAATESASQGQKFEQLQPQQSTSSSGSSNASSSSIAVKKAWLHKWAEQQMEKQQQQQLISLQTMPPPMQPPSQARDSLKQEGSKQSAARSSDFSSGFAATVEDSSTVKLFAKTSRKRQSIAGPIEAAAERRIDVIGEGASETDVKSAKRRVSLLTPAVAVFDLTGPTSASCPQQQQQQPPLVALQGNSCSEQVYTRLPLCCDCQHRLAAPTVAGLKCRFKQFRKLCLHQGVLLVSGFCSLSDISDVDRIRWQQQTSIPVSQRLQRDVALKQLSLLQAPLHRLVQRESDAVARWAGGDVNQILWRRNRERPFARHLGQPSIQTPLNEDQCPATASNDLELCSRCHCPIFSLHLCCLNCGYSLCLTCCSSAAAPGNQQAERIRIGSFDSDSCPAWRHEPDRMKLVCLLPPELLVNLVRVADQLLADAEPVAVPANNSPSNSGEAVRISLPLESLTEFQTEWIKQLPVVLTGCLELSATKGFSSSCYSLPRQCFNSALFDGAGVVQSNLPSGQTAETAFWRQAAVSLHDENSDAKEDARGRLLHLIQWPAPSDVEQLMTNTVPEYFSPRGSFNLALRTQPSSSRFVSGHSGSGCSLQVAHRDLVSLALLPPAASATASSKAGETQLPVAAIWRVFPRERLLRLRNIRDLDDSTLTQLDNSTVRAIEVRQRCGEAVVLPAGCAFQFRFELTCTQAQLDFSSPESLGQCLSNNWTGIVYHADCLEASVFQRVQLCVASLADNF